MRRFIFAAIDMLFANTAQADTTHWTAAHPPQSNAALRAASQSCGGDPLGLPTSAEYKRCMRSQGWIYTNTTRDNEWVNHHGMTCHHILNGGGSECDSVW